MEIKNLKQIHYNKNICFKLFNNFCRGKYDYNIKCNNN